MISFIAFIITFYLFIPSFRRMDRRLHRNGDSLYARIWKFLFHDGVDAELNRVRYELDHLGNTSTQHREKLSDPSIPASERTLIEQHLSMTTGSFVKLVRRYEVDMTDEQFEQAKAVLKDTRIGNW
jgi:hypothetical protein